MAYISNFVVLSYPTVNLLSTGSTQLFTTENGTQRFVPMFIHLEVTSLTGTIVTGASFSVGSNSTSYNNLLPITASSTGILGNLFGIQQFNVLTAAATTSIAANTSIFLKVTTAAVGPTVYTVRPDVIGYYM